MCYPENSEKKKESAMKLVLIDIDNTLPPPGSGALPCPTGHGIALANVRDRLRLLHDVQGRFSAGPHNGGYRVHIGIPL